MRTKRNIIKNKFYHIYNMGFQKGIIFETEEDYYRFITLMREAIIETDIALYAYCILPNRFHFLMKVHDADSLRKCMHKITFRYAQYYNRYRGRTGSVWHGHYKCEEQYNLASAKECIKKIEALPLVENLSKDKYSWHYSSATRSKLAKLPTMKIDPHYTKKHYAQDMVQILHEAIFESPKYRGDDIDTVVKELELNNAARKKLRKKGDGKSLADSLRPLQ